MISTCGPPTKLHSVPPNGDHTAKLRTTDFSATTSSPSDRSTLSTQPQARWWRRSGSNRRPPACKAGALPAELRPQRHPYQASLRNLTRSRFHARPSGRLLNVQNRPQALHHARKQANLASFAAVCKTPLAWCLATAPAGAAERRERAADVVGQGGFEPPTPRLSSVCSHQLSY